MKKSTLRNKADRLLQEYIKLLYEGKPCFVCRERPIVCGHHFISKAHSTPCRYFLPNIIPICKECHYLVHSRPWKVEPEIVLRLGDAWYQKLREREKQKVKANLEWYQGAIDFLQKETEILRREET